MAHLACLTAASQHEPGAELLVHVSSGAYKSNAWPLEVRTKLTRLAFDGHPHVEVVSFNRRENYQLTDCARELVTVRDGRESVRVLRLAGSDWVDSFTLWEPRSLTRFLLGIDGLMILQRPSQVSDEFDPKALKERLKEHVATMEQSTQDHISQLYVRSLEMPEVARNISSSGVSSIIAAARHPSELDRLRDMVPPQLFELFVRDFNSYRMFTVMAQRHIHDVFNVLKP